MKFEVISSEIAELRRKLQEVQSTAYVILPVDDHKLISFLDADTVSMGYTVVNADMIEIKLISELPPTVLIAFGKFVEAMERWQSGDIEEFPFSQYAATEDALAEILSPFDYVAPDKDINGDEGKIE